MSVVATGAGHFLIPTAPAAGTSVTSGTAPGFTSTAVVLSASTSAIYITGIYVESAAASAATYIIVRLMQGGAGAETAICDCPVALSTGSTVALGFFEIWPPLKVANATRLSVKTADSVGAKATLITVQCILQSNVVDDGIAVGTVTTVTNQLTGAAIATALWGDTVAGDFTVAASVGKSVMNGVALGTGLTVNALTTNNDKTGYGLSSAAVSAIWQDATAGDFTAANSIGKSIMNGVSLGTGLTINGYTGNTPQTGDSFARIGAAGAGLTALGDTRIAHLDADVSSRMATFSLPTNFSALGISATGHISNVDTLTTYTGNTVQTGDAYARIGLAGVGLTNLGDTRIAHLDADVSSRLASASYTAPDNTSIAAIKVQTDKLTFTVASKLDCNIRMVNSITVNGAGTALSPWGP